MDAIRAITMPGVNTLAHAQAAPAAPVSAPARVTPVAGHERTGRPLQDRLAQELERDPMGGEVAALDRLSASITYDPRRGADQARVPGASLEVTPGNALTRMTTEQVDSLSTPDFLAASQSTMAAISGAGLTGGLELATAALAKDPRTGQDAYDRRLGRLEDRKAQLLEAMKSAPPALQLELLKEANAVATEILLVQRDHEKLEAMRRLLFSLMCGVVPKHLIARMVELGMGGIVEKAIEDLVGSGRSISKSMSQQLQAVGASLGLQLHIAPAEQTFDAMQQEDQRLADAGHTLVDGRRVDAHGRLVAAAGELASQGGSSAPTTR
ncbi:MAG: hypothetical protein JWM86_252 [Thermoleophilia bacterium]|nr:hypothetical protein [Thermoleophilia bacterium]